MDEQIPPDSLSGAESKLLVQQGYDKIAQTYLKWTSEKPTARLQYLEKLLRVAGDTSEFNVLELGCGAGIPGTQFLAERCSQVSANDISESQINLAKRNVPGENVRFIRDDMTSLKIEASSLQLVVAFYSIIHLPRDEQRTMMAQIWSWLSPGGYLVCNLGVGDDAGSARGWLDSTKMYWSSYDADTNLRSLRGAGFAIVESEILLDDEDGRPVPFLWILARKDVKS
ncbi:hypothetical protein H2200_006228 [Cladophialophora chaetospira]|uniref:Methyltransferase domain-containing protein n=1 Tax=Cladophialophora chaetospira TaxID=386627 RepID=A0AA39CIX1_9EURO|nr:hypothetical protein H2200_006228 [Cladophialophora chaetospira]